MSRFVFFSSIRGWGGSEELWAGAAALLADSGHSVTIFKPGFDPNHPRICQLLALGCRIRDLRQVGLPSGIRLPKPLARLAESLVRISGRSTAQKAIRPLVRAHLAHLNPDLVVVCQGVNFDGLAYSDLCRISAVGQGPHRDALRLSERFVLLLCLPTQSPAYGMPDR